MRSGPRSLLLAAVLILAVVGLATPAQAATCTFTAPTATVDVPDGDVTAIARSGDAITVGGVPCGTATVTTTDTIVVNTPGFPLEVAIDLTGGPFAPGASTRATGAPRSSSR